MPSPIQELTMSTPTLTAATAGAGAAGAAAGEDGAKKSKKKLMLVLPLVLALVGGAVWFFLLRGSGSEEAAHEEPKPGAVVALESINVNLADGHYLKLKLALQASADAHETVIDVYYPEFVSQ